MLLSQSLMRSKALLSQVYVQCHVVQRHLIYLRTQLAGLGKAGWIIKVHAEIHGTHEYTDHLYHISPTPNKHTGHCMIVQ